MNDRLVRKFENFGPLPEEDKALLRQVTSVTRTVPTRTDIISEGDVPADVHLILEGFACRYKVTSEGKRQIVAYLVPGDFCDAHVFILEKMDHSIGTLSPCTIVSIPRPRVLEMLERPALAKAFWWVTLVDEAVLREWIVNLGTRDAEERIAHLLCELLLRLRAVGLANGDSFELPITQAELGDTVGVSHVHVNRSLQALREEKLITIGKGHVVILDSKRLAKISGFYRNYLHLYEAS